MTPITMSMDEEHYYWSVIDSLQPYVAPLETLLKRKGPIPKIEHCLNMLRNNRMFPNMRYIVKIDVLEKTRVALAKYLPHIKPLPLEDEQVCVYFFVFSDKILCCIYERLRMVTRL